jgi:hypothetical protein
MTVVQSEFQRQLLRVMILFLPFFMELHADRKGCIRDG